MTLFDAIDAHCHLQHEQLIPHMQRVMENAAFAKVRFLMSCARHEGDWSREYDCEKVIQGFGVHPWYADTVSEMYTKKLKAKLALFPQAFVGEIGLCKSRKSTVEMSTQVQVLCEQLRIAKESRRTAVIHCVKAHGKLLDILQKPDLLPMCIVLHSFSGSEEIIAAYLKLKTRVYFSQSAMQLSGASEKIIQCCRKIPFDQLLLETDAPDQLPNLTSALGQLSSRRISDELNEPMFVQLAIQNAAEIRNVTEADMAAQVYRNAVFAFSIN